MNLADLVYRSKVCSLAVVGTAKNVGKTVTMNYLVRELTQRGLTAGLISSGRDGETVDSFTGEPKPSVVPPEGSWIATAEGVLGQAGTGLEIVDVSDSPGLLGRLVIGRVIEPFPLELVGPRSAAELGRLVKKLLSLGADMVLVDGALDRVAASSPSVTDASILATGAAAGDNLEDIASAAAFLAWLWARPVLPDPAARDQAKRALDSGYVTFLDEASGKGVSLGEFLLRRTEYTTCLGFEEDIMAEAGDARFVAVPGAVSQDFVGTAASWAKREDFSVVAKDAVSLFFKEQPPISVYVNQEIDLMAITVNPVSYYGISYDPEEMVSVIGKRVRRQTGRQVPVFDVLSGEMSSKGVTGMAMG